MLPKFLDFMKKSPKKYPSGEKAKTQRSAWEKTFAETRRKELSGNKGTLSEAMQNQFRNEEAILKQALDAMESTTLGKDVLEQMNRLGYSISFQTSLDAYGGTDHDNKKIMINPNLQDPLSISSTLVHESVHAIQRSNAKKMGVKNDMHGYQTSDFIKFKRAQEADACAYQSAYLFELKDNYPEVLASRSVNCPMYEAYSQEMSSSADQGKASQAAFKAWYGYDVYRDMYNDVHAKKITAYASKNMKLQSTSGFKNTVSSSEVKKMCFSAGGRDMPDDFFTSKEAFSLPPEHKNKIARSINAYCSKIKGAKKDTSFLMMPDAVPQEQNTSLFTKLASVQQTAPQQTPSRETVTQVAASIQTQPSGITPQKSFTR